MKKVMSRLSLIVVSLLISVAAWAVKAQPGPTLITQSDGSKVMVYAYGDSNNHWYTTSDGVLLCREGYNFYVAKVDAEGNLTPTAQLAHEMSQRNEAEMRLAKAQDRKLFYKKSDEERARKARRNEPIADDHTLFFHTGSPRALVILAEFTDSVFKDSDPKSVFEQYLNAETIDNTVGNATVGRNYGSVKKYFSDMSFGAFTPQFDIYGPVKLSHNLKYYGEGKNDRMDRLIPEVCQLADNQVDFSQYDENGDGYVDLVYIICASYSASWTKNSSDCIWPKSGSAANYSKSDFGTYDGKKVYRFGVHTELNAYPGAFAQPYRINGIGLFCHEFSHCMGLPDIYPTSTAAQNAFNPGMEYWDLMDGGEYVYNGYYPTEYSAWQREAMGWFTIDTLKTTDKGNITLRNINSGGKAYRIINEQSNGQTESVLLQFIQKTGWNYRLEGHGLLVSHIDYDATAFSLGSNSVNNTIGHPRYTIIPADGEYISSSDKQHEDIYRTSMAGDPFPGTSAATELLTLPWYTGDDTAKPLLNIAEGGTGTSANVTFDYIVPNDIFEEKEGFVIDSVFANAIVSDDMVLTNASVTSYENGDYLIEATDFSDAEIGLANGFDVSTLDSLHLNAYSYDDIDLKVELVFDADDNNVNGIKRNADEEETAYGTVSLVGREWNNIDLEIEKLAAETADLSNLKGIRLSGGNGKTIFLNNIYFFGEILDSIQEVKNNASTAESIYTLEGIRVSSARENLNKGVYIINGKKYIIR